MSVSAAAQAQSKSVDIRANGRGMHIVAHNNDAGDHTNTIYQTITVRSATSPTDSSRVANTFSDNRNEGVYIHTAESQDPLRGTPGSVQTLNLSNLSVIGNYGAGIRTGFANVPDGETSSLEVNFANVYRNESGGIEFGANGGTTEANIKNTLVAENVIHHDVLNETRTSRLFGLRLDNNAIDCDSFLSTKTCADGISSPLSGPPINTERIGAYSGFGIVAVNNDQSGTRPSKQTLNIELENSAIFRHQPTALSATGGDTKLGGQILLSSAGTTNDDSSILLNLKEPTPSTERRISESALQVTENADGTFTRQEPGQLNKSAAITICDGLSSPLTSLADAQRITFGGAISITPSAAGEKVTYNPVRLSTGSCPGK